MQTFANLCESAHSGPSWTTIAWRQVGFHQATSTVTLQLPVVTHELRLLHAKFLTAKFSHLNYFQSISKCKKLNAITGKPLIFPGCMEMSVLVLL